MFAELSPALLMQLRLSTGLSKSELYGVLATAPRRYKVYQIPKKAGGMRTIAQPSREVKRIQYALLDSLRPDFPVHDAACAYVTGKSIAQNASAHAGKNAILKMDFRNFFNSITADQFKTYLGGRRPDLSADDVEAITLAFFWRPRPRADLVLSIGAPSSPLVSNAMMFERDVLFSQVAEEFGASYTRYADDLTFSHPSAMQLWGISRAVRQVSDRVIVPRLQFEDAKTRVFSPRGNRTVTGVVLTNDGKLSLGRDRKREISAACHRFTLNRLSHEDVRQLNGWLGLANAIEPAFLGSIERKYGAGTIAAIKSAFEQAAAA